MKSFIIYDWMLKDERLSGIKLLIYAVAFSFVNFNHPCFLSIESWIRLLHCSKSQFYKARKELISDRILIVSHDGFIVSCDTSFAPLCFLNVDDEEIKEICRIAKTPWVYDE